MRLLSKLHELLDYGLFFVALLPTLAILSAAVLCFVGGEGPAVTMPMIALYSPN